MTRDQLTQEEFRLLFPALRDWAWLDTPGSPPAARPVFDALSSTLRDWLEGRFRWLDWDAALAESRGLFAGLAGVDEATVSAHSSAAEAVATVARSLPPGSIIVPDGEYRSVLFPLLALDQGRNPVIRVPAKRTVTPTQALAEAVREDTVLVAASDTLTSSGYRFGVTALAGAAHAAGASLLMDLTQSFGILDYDLPASGIDHAVVHGYKWLLCPRGAAWMASSPAALDRLDPLMPNWKSTGAPHGYFGGELGMLAASAGKLDTSPAWLSWIGSVAALESMSRIPRGEVEAHCVGLARSWLAGVAELGCTPVLEEQRSHIAVAELPRVVPDLTGRLERDRVKATATGRRLRIGVHFFNSANDITRATDSLRQALDRASPER
jgi:selenocysteine lyase/cysteine desulfurase